MQKRDVVRALEQSALAYQEVQPQLPGERLTVIDDPASGVQCYLRRRGDALSVTFRGTNSLRDWKTDFTFWKKTIPYNNTASPIRVHSGFIGAYKTPAVRDVILAAVTPEVRRIQVAGHSYGAALAVLCAVDLQYNFPDRAYQAMLFGCPRVGNKAFQMSYDKRVFKTVRVEYGNDIVTKIPFAWMGFRHVGIRLRIGPRRLPGSISFRDHRPQRYWSALFTQLPS